MRVRYFHSCYAARERWLTERGKGAGKKGSRDPRPTSRWRGVHVGRGITVPAAGRRVADFHTEQATARLPAAHSTVPPFEAPKAAAAKGGIEEEAWRGGRQCRIAGYAPGPVRKRWGGDSTASLKVKWGRTLKAADGREIGGGEKRIRDVGPGEIVGGAWVVDLVGRGRRGWYRGRRDRGRRGRMVRGRREGRLILGFLPAFNFGSSNIKLGILGSKH